MTVARDSYACEENAVDVIRAEMGRIERGAAMLEVTLAVGQLAKRVPTLVNVRGSKPETAPSPRLDCGEADEHLVLERPDHVHGAENST